jgi:hypothetical protein
MISPGFDSKDDLKKRGYRSVFVPLEAQTQAFGFEQKLFVRNGVKLADCVNSRTRCRGQRGFGVKERW